MDIYDLFNKTQSDIVEKSFKAVRNIENMSEADTLECYLNNGSKHNLLPSVQKSLYQCYVWSSIAFNLLSLISSLF